MAKVTEGHIKRLDLGQRIDCENGDYFYKYSDGQYRKVMYLPDGECDEERYTRDELLDVDNEIISYDLEQRNLVLQELLARQCFGVTLIRAEGPAYRAKLHHVEPNSNRPIVIDRGDYMPAQYEVESFKMELRPLSSMTEEEEAELANLLEELYEFTFNTEELLEPVSMMKTFPMAPVDWFYKRGFDIRGLIPMGLAVEKK